MKSPHSWQRAVARLPAGLEAADQCPRGRAACRMRGAPAWGVGSGRREPLLVPLVPSSGVTITGMLNPWSAPSGSITMVGGDAEEESDTAIMGTGGPST